MKKYLYLLFVAMFASMTFALTGCSDDDDEPTSSNGKYELTIDGKKYSFDRALPNDSGTDYACMLYDNDNILSFSISGWDKVVKGTALTDKNFILGWNSNKAVIGKPAANTSVKVTARDLQSVTISFNNAKFEDGLGIESFTVNGTVTLPLK